MPDKIRELLPILTEMIEIITEMGYDVAKCELSNSKAPAVRAKQSVWKIEKKCVSLKSELYLIIKKNEL
jgi:hypothetical protein